MRVLRLKPIAITLAVLFLIVCVNVRFRSTPKQRIAEEEDEESQPVCLHPVLNPYNEQIVKHIKDLGKLTCDVKEEDWLSTVAGRVEFNPEVVRQHGRISCILRYLQRMSDFKSVEGKKVAFTSDTMSTNLEGDFFTVQCTAEDGRKWENIMAGVHRNEDIVKRALRSKSDLPSMGLNVLIFGLDSMSRMHYMRKLPKTYSYINETLGATILTGYNIVGDGTPQALIPIFTGMTEPELPETRKRMRNANRVDVYPFAWHDFVRRGYVTAYGEDMSYVGTFTYRMTGFKDEPTDHYMRTFYVKAESLLKNHPRLCFGSTPRHRVMLNYLRQFYDVYSDIPKFAFLFHSELSHDDYNLVGYADADIAQFLKDLNDDGLLNTTLLIVMSDHGHRFASIRETQQGKQEERLPFFSIAVPPWVEEKYPHYVRNLRVNGGRLTTPFDIHATLMTLLNPNVSRVGDVSRRSISLFSEVPKERTCKHADVEAHWCACLAWTMIPTTDVNGKNAALKVLDYINDLTDPHRDQCALLTLDRVTRAEKLTPNKALLTFKKNADYDGFVGDFSDDTKVTEVLYQVQLVAAPSQGVYEASLKYDVRTGAFGLRPQDISRVNVYKNQEHCIHDAFPSLGKYCYCHVQLT